MRQLKISIFALGLTFGLAGAAIAADAVTLPVGAGVVAGYWQGTNTASQLPGRKIPVAFVLNQSGSSVTGGYVAASGVYGDGSGSFSGTQGTMTWTNSTPSCPGTYTNSYALVGNVLSWTYKGDDCLGPETGSGQAVRIPITSTSAK